VNVQLALEVLFWPFVACLVLTGIHTYLGLHVVSRGVIFVDLALAQIAALGATYAFLLGYAPDSNKAYFYSLLFASLGAAIFSISRLKKQKIPQEAIIGITFAVASATAIMLADRSPQGAEFVEAMLTGALLWTPRFKILETATIYACVGAFHWYFRHRFLTLSLEPELAEAEGWNVRWWDFLFYASFGFVITSSVSIAGVLLVFSFLVIPSVIAMMFSTSIGGRLAIGWTAGTLVSMVGLSLSYGYDFPSGPAVVCTFGLALILAATVRYVVFAESRQLALAKVAATVVIVVGALWLSFYTAARDVAAAEAAADSAAAAADIAPPSETPREVVLDALAALEATPNAPPEDAVDTLLAQGENLHRMMSSGEVEISESVIAALANVPDRDGLGDLLNEVAFHAADPWVRLRAAQLVVQRRDPLGLEAILDLMATQPPLLLQIEAMDTLRSATGQNFGFEAGGDAAANQAAIEEWRAWWRLNAADPFTQNGG
jgi:zinc/manganese transport system permease protein